MGLLRRFLHVRREVDLRGRIGGGILEPLSYYLERQTAIWIMRMILLLMFSVQLAAFLHALSAYRFQRGSGGERSSS